jgi:hypothetical protein
MPEDDFGFTDLGFGDRFVFVPANSSTTLTASDVLNIVTANSQQNFVDFPNTSFVNAQFAFNPPQIESVNNGDDIFVRFTSNDNSIVFEVFANADGSNTDITIRNLLLDPVDFAALIASVSYEDILTTTDIDLETVFGDLGFVLQNPFAGGDLTQGLDGVSFDGLSLSDGSLFGSLFGSGFGGGSFNDGNAFGSYDFFSLSGNYDSFGGGGGSGGGRFYEAYSSYDGIDYINLDIWG